ncbi:MAG TPA: ABC transporter permease [Nocardia sp.]|uniref:ABC transporter permease n=1 Tax=Nocardia sp. TaxID=1821 RepID=UPI002B4B1F1F|nr:ABC transporter permease [Nocardia sp.]HLS77155.1 ABC transporter permease [Nocardia sp.]
MSAPTARWSSGPRSRLRYVLARVGQGLVVLGLSYLVVFLLLFLLPGDPIRARLSDPEANFTQEQVDQLLTYYGMDKPVWEQLWRTLARLAHGDLGYSLTTVEPVTDRIAEALPATLELAAVTTLFALLLAAALTALATTAPWQPVRRFATAVPAALLSVPTFVIGLLVLQIFSYQLGLFSTLRADGWAGAVPPAAVLALPVAAPLTRVLIEHARRTQGEPYVTFARSKGLGQGRLLLAHVARPSALPGVTMLGLAVAELVTGSVIVEAVFNRHGIGSVIEAAVSNQDSPTLLGIILLAATLVVLVNLVVDLLYPVLDPRLRAEPGRSAEVSDAAPRRAPATGTRTVEEAVA